MYFSSDKVEEVWEMATKVRGYNPKVWRKDCAGAWIRRDFYGILNEYGWEIDHKKPQNMGGDNSIDNLWAMHWKNKREKSDSYPQFYTCITSASNKNIYKKQSWKWKK